MNFRGIIIEESLQDIAILGEVTTLSTKKVEQESSLWHMRKVAIPEEEIDEIVKKLSKSLKPNEPWYAHFYHEDPKNAKMIVVFYRKEFRVSKNDPALALNYGLSLGIPEHQLDFKPKQVAQETW